MSRVVRIRVFSDVLCVWAWVGQRRVHELVAEFGTEVELERRFVSVFGNAGPRLAERWADQGGLAGYARHVQGVAAGFDHVRLHPDTWARVAPASSTPAHLWLCAVRALEGAGVLGAGACSAALERVRQAFFEEARDVARRATLHELTEELALPPAPVFAAIDGGDAHAALAADSELAREADIRTSPTLLMNEGRQRLVGNVGYRVLAANVRELLERPDPPYSWC